MSISLTCPRGHSFTVEDESIGTKLPCPECGMLLLVFVEARPVWNIAGEMLSIWRNEKQLIVLTNQMLCLVQFKDEESARCVHDGVSQSKMFPSSFQGQPDIVIIPLEALIKIQVVQDFEDSDTLYIDVAASVPTQPDRKEIRFCQQDDRDQAVAKLQELLHCGVKTEQVGLGEAIAFPCFCTAILLFAIPVYWMLAYFLEGRDLATAAWTWFLLHLPINILGIKWTSMILGCSAALFLILLIRRTIRHPLRVTLLPRAREQNGEIKNSGQVREVPGCELITEQADHGDPTRKGTGA